jgi:flagellar hook-associated protein 3 FlgL
MVERVTANSRQNNSLRNIFRITAELSDAQRQISTGKRIEKPSDDPTGTRDTLSLRTGVSRTEQFTRNIDNNRIFLQSSDSALNTIGTSLNRAKELAIQGLGGTATASTRTFAADEINNLLEQVLQSGNTKVKNLFVFSGTDTRSTPFEVSASGAVYRGSTSKFDIPIADNAAIEFSLPGSDVLAVDLDPSIDNNTSLSVLNAGTGVSAGSFTITNRAGSSATLTVSAGDTIGTLISNINAAGINVTASINAESNGLTLTDSSTTILGELTIAEAGGNTAQNLGILGSRDGVFAGTDLNPAVSSATLISQLNNGSGTTLNSISIVNGAASGTVSLSSATTIGDVITAINSSGLNVTASINRAGNGLRVQSNSSATVAIVNEVGTGNAAETLGIGGGRNVLNTLVDLRDALRKSDSRAIIASLTNLDSAISSVAESRAILGGIQGRIESTYSFHQVDIVAQQEQISNIEDADLAQQASRLATLEFALQSTLNATSRIIQPTLLDFLR